MKTALNICLILKYIAAPSVASAECKRRILLIPQFHAPQFNIFSEFTPLWAEAIAKSQFNIAQFVAKDPDLPIFSEEIETDRTMKTMSEDFKRIIPPVVKRLFPKGLPERYTLLSAEQKDFISEAGGDVLSLVMGKIPKLHRVMEAPRWSKT